MKILRPKPDYFAVGYYGQGYPPFLRVCVCNILTSQHTHADSPASAKRSENFISTEAFCSSGQVSKYTSEIVNIMGR